MDFLRSDFFLILVLVVSVAAVVIGGLNLYLNMRIKKTFKDLGITSNSDTLDKILSEYLSKVSLLTSHFEELDGFTKRLSSRVDKKLGKVGFMRFNPYGDTGGDQSFSAVFLDDQDNGVLITTLFRRGQTQTYAKKILAGKAETNLTDEETKVINEALGG